MSSPDTLRPLSEDELAGCRGGLSSTALFRAFGAANVKIGEAKEYHRTNSLRNDLASQFGLGATETEYLTQAIDRVAKFSAQAERFLEAAKRKLLAE